MTNHQRMRLLVVTSFNDRSERALYRGFKEAGIDVEVMCSPRAPEIAELRNADIPVSTFEIRHRLDLSVVGRIRKRLKETAFDVLYLPRNHSLSVGLMASRGLKVKTIGYRGTIGHLSWFDPASWITYLNRRLDKIICNSNAVMAYLRSLHVPESRLAMIYKGHDVSWYESKASGLEEFGIPGGAFVVGFAGCIREVKGVDVLLEAALRLGNDDNSHFLLVGEVRDSSLVRLAQDPRIRDRIHLPGFRKDASALMGACDVFVMPSLEREGFPRAVIEAMAQEVPPIVTTVGGMPEMVADGESGVLVPPADPGSLAAAIVKLRDDAQLRERLGSAARDKIRGAFNIDETTRRMIALFEDLLRKP